MNIGVHRESMRCMGVYRGEWVDMYRGTQVSMGESVSIGGLSVYRSEWVCIGAHKGCV